MDMIRFSLAQSVHDFHAVIPGTYGLYLVGGFSVNSLEKLLVSVSSLGSDKEIIIERVRFKTRSIVDGKRAIECFLIQLPERGDYQLRFKNAELISMNRSVLFLMNWLFRNTIPFDNIEAILELRQ
jgi:hypothetical protein